MSYLNEVNLEGTTAFRDNNFLAPIPEDNANSSNAVPSTGRQDSGGTSSRRQGRWREDRLESRSTTGSSILAVVESEQPSVAHSSDSNQQHKQNKCQCNRKTIIISIIIILVAVVVIIALSQILGHTATATATATSQPSQPPSIMTSQPSVRPVDDDFLPTDSPTATPTAPPSTDLPLSPELQELDALFQEVLGSIVAGSPQAQARSWFFSDSADIRVATHGTYRVIQRFILAILYYAWGADLLSNYLTEDHECNWDGIFCNDQDMVVGLFFRSLNLQGPLLPELPQLSTLQGISLGNNSLTGTIPNSWWDWPTLGWFDVSANNISGHISSDVWEMQSLTVLNLVENSITGTFPDLVNATLSAIQRVNLGSNQITGTLPRSLLNSDTLEVLYLDSNNFTGTLPNIEGSLTSLTQLRLYENALTGSIPPSFAQLQNLEELILYGNMLTSTIPTQLFELASLQYIDLSENNFTGNLKNMSLAPSLQYMYFTNNSLTGPLPSALPESIKQAWFSSNLFSGSIPTDIGVGRENLTMLLIQNNLLEGKVPGLLCDQDLRQLEADCFGNNSHYVECSCCTECF